MRLTTRTMRARRCSGAWTSLHTRVGRVEGCTRTAHPPGAVLRTAALQHCSSPQPTTAHRAPPQRADDPTEQIELVHVVSDPLRSESRPISGACSLQHFLLSKNTHMHVHVHAQPLACRGHCRGRRGTAAATSLAPEPLPGAGEPLPANVACLRKALHEAALMMSAGERKGIGSPSSPHSSLRPHAAPRARMAHWQAAVCPHQWLLACGLVACLLVGSRVSSRRRCAPGRPRAGSLLGRRPCPHMLTACIVCKARPQCITRRIPTCVRACVPRSGQARKRH